MNQNDKKCFVSCLVFGQQLKYSYIYFFLLTFFDKILLGTQLTKDSSTTLCRGGMVLWSAKVPKALCQSGNVASHRPALIKKTATLCFVFNSFITFELSFTNTKPLRFRFGGAVCSIPQLFFWLSCHLGLTVSFGKDCRFWKKASKMPKPLLNICVDTVW